MSSNQDWSEHHRGVVRESAPEVPSFTAGERLALWHEIESRFERAKPGRGSRRFRQAENEHVRLREVPSVISGVDPDRVRAVRDALASLSDRDRELIRLTEWEQLTTSEAAAILGLRPGTARVRFHRARRAIQRFRASSSGRLIR